MYNFYKYKYEIILSFIILIIYILFFRYIVLFVDTDIQIHTEALITALSKGFFPIPPLYYITLYSLSILIENLYNCVVIVLSVAVAAKYVTSVYIVNKLFEVNKIAVLFAFLSILIVTPINFDIESNFLVGKLGMNIWHNSTTIFLMPFALLLFYQSYLFIENECVSKKRILIISILILLNALSKPSFLLAFAPVFSATVIIFHRNNTHKIKIAIGMSLYTTLCVVLEYIYLYVQNPYEANNGGVSFSFMYVWKLYSKNILLDSILSLALPIVVFVLFFRRAINKKIYIYAVLLFIVALLIYIFVQETGLRATHGNFGWQVIVCNYILFLISVSIGLEYVKEKGLKNIKSIIFFTVFLFHFISGILYIMKLTISGNYY